MRTRNSLEMLAPISWNHHAQPAIRICDTRGESETAPRWWTIWTRCTCEQSSCGCPKDRPHYHRYGKSCTRAEASELSEKGSRCVDCGG